MTRTTTIVGLMVVTGLTMSTLAGFAQSPPKAGTRVEAPLDPRWVPWLGCWQLSEEQFEVGAPALDKGTSTLVGQTHVCVTPAAGGPGVDLTAVAGGDVLVARTLAADGTRQEVRNPGCVGWEESEWATDGHRLFTRAELRCGEQPTRTVDGVSLMTSATTWVDIQVVDTGTHAQLEVRRYTPVPAAEQRALPLTPAKIRQARGESAAALTLDDVMEASRKTATQVVEALLVETEPQLALNSAALIALDDAGIDEGVIDLLVALSYPERFVVERRDRGGSWSTGGFSGAYDPVWYGALYPYYVTPFGYRGLGRGYSPYLLGGFGSPFVVVAEGDTGDGTGKAVLGRGYTRIRPRDVSGAPRMAKPRGGSSATRSGSSGSGSSQGTSTRSRSGSTSSEGAATASPGGYSRGGSSADRRAVPRK